jgi:cytochrome o ubiquinol oxidase operon protein cyoD
MSGSMLLTAIFTFAFLQLFVQLYFFLHLGQEEKPAWNLVFFIATVGVIFIVVAGSVWIMNHLNYNMTPQQMLHYVQNEQGF